MQTTLRFRSGLFIVSVLLSLLAGFAFFAPFAHGDTATATPALVQSAHNSTTGVATFSGAVTSGNTVIVGVTAWQATLSATNIKDNKGNTYSRVGEVINATTGDHAAIYYATNVVGGASFTVTSAAGGTVAIHEYSGIATSSPLDKTASATGSSIAPKSANVTTSSANELYFGLAWSGGNNDTWSAGSGYALRQSEINNNTYERLATEDKVIALASTTNASFGTGKSSDWIAVVATFRPQVITTGGGTPAKPTISSFTATPGSITAGQSSTLAWAVTNASSTSIDQNIGTVTGTSQSVSPSATTTYTLTASNPQGSVTAQVTVSVVPAAKIMPSCTISANPTSIVSGQSSTLTFAGTNASSSSISGGVGSVANSGTAPVSPTTTTTYVDTVTNPNGTGTCSATVTVTPAPVKPAISSFTATPGSITAGQSSTLAWNVTGATLLTIDNGVGTVTGTSKAVSPTATTTYILTASNAAGTTTAMVTVNVAPVVVTPPSNLIPNGNFEAGTTGAPTSWTHDYWGSVTPTFTYPVTGNGGGKAAQITITSGGAGSGAANWIFPRVTTDDHTQYQYTEDYTATAATELDVEYLMSDGTFKYDWLMSLPTSTTWKSVTAQVTPPTGAVSFDVLHILGKKGTLTIDNAALSAINDPFPQGMLTLTFDDGLLSQYQNALPIIKAAGLKAGFYIITTEPGDQDVGYMNWTQVKDLFNQGYEIGAHTRVHDPLTTKTASQLTSEVSGSRSDLIAQGITPQTFVYPYGDENPTVEAAVKAAGFKVARGSYTGENGTVSNRYALYDVRVDSTTSLATIESYIAQAKADKRWLILELHDVLASGGDVESITPSYLQSLVTYIKNSGIQVTTLEQGSALLAN